MELALYRAAFERSRYAMAIVDDDGLVREANTALGALTGRPVPELVGRDRRIVIEPGADREVEAQQAALRRGRGWIGTYAVALEVGSGMMDVCADPALVPGRHLVLYVPRPGAVDAIPDAADVVVPTEPLRLTARQREIVARLAEGATSPQLAAGMHVSEHTIRTHVRNAMSRTGARTRAHLVIVALRAGLLDETAPPAHENGAGG